MAITIVEPRPQVGPGLAYSCIDRDHRLNGTPATHWIDPTAPWEFQNWCDRRGIVVRDPEARTPEGSIFARRADFGAFLAEQVRAHEAGPNGVHDSSPARPGPRRGHELVSLSIRLLGY